MKAKEGLKKNYVFFLIFFHAFSKVVCKQLERKKYIIIGVRNVQDSVVQLLAFYFLF